MQVSNVLKPELIFQPKMLLKRLLGRRAKVHHTLPWGAAIDCVAGEAIDESLSRLGIYDLAVTEAAFRLLDKGEHALDIGANIGYMSAVCAAAVGTRGSVTAFEPHPMLFSQLEANIKLWNAAPVTAHMLALSDTNGEVLLQIPEGFEGNSGLASLEVIENAQSSIAISARRLDDLISNDRSFALGKIDVEGHELSALKGAELLLAAKRVRDWIFEDHSPMPSPVSRLFESYGYTVMRIGKSFFGPKLFEQGSPIAQDGWEPPNYIATLDKPRAIARFKPLGWNALRFFRS